MQINLKLNGNKKMVTYIQENNFILFYLFIYLHIHKKRSHVNIFILMIYKKKIEVSKKHALLSEWLIREVKQLHTSYNAGKQLLHDTKQQHSIIGHQTEQIVNQIKIALDDFEKLQDTLDEQTNLLIQAEKKRDRLKSKVIESVSNGGIDCLTEDFLDPHEKKPITTVASSSSTSTPNTSLTITTPSTSNTDNKPSISNQEVNIIILS